MAPEFDRIRNNIKDVSNEVKDVKNKVDALKERIDTLEDNITGDIANLQNENQVTSSYNQRLNVVEAKLGIVG